MILPQNDSFFQTHQKATKPRMRGFVVSGKRVRKKDYAFFFFEAFLAAFFTAFLATFFFAAFFFAAIKVFRFYFFNVVMVDQ